MYSMFVLRTKQGACQFSTEMDTVGQEITYPTKKEAADALKKLEDTLPKGLFKVTEITRDELVYESKVYSSDHLTN